MDQIRHFDWCYNEPESEYFVTEEVMDNSCIERILSNKFYDPLISSDEEETPPNINWDEVFTRVNSDEPITPRTYVPGLRPVPPYPRLSTLSRNQQSQLLKVVSSMYPNVLESVHVPRPTKFDRRLYEDLKEKYEREQKEFIAWAKTLWASGHNIRALRPKPTVETVYEAEFKVKMTEHKCLPKQYEMAAQISLKTDAGSCEFVPQKDLIRVNLSEMPAHIPMSDLFCKKVNIAKPIASPEPCPKHPCKFVLPGDNTISELPLTEIQRELAQYTIDNGARFCVSETALRKFVDGSAWNISVAVRNVTGPDGQSCNVVVIGNDFAIQREHSQIRTYKAFRHLLLNTLIPPAEKARLINSWNRPPAETNKKPQENLKVVQETQMDVSDDDDDDDEETALVIDIDTNLRDEQTNTQEITETTSQLDENREEEEIEENGFEKNETKDRLSGASDEDGESQLPQLYSCTCDDLMYDRPPPRSFRRWEARCKTNYNKFQVIVHCSHKLKGKSGEVIVEPIPEYQIDLGASEIAVDKMKSLALAMHLRKSASVLLMRIDGSTGDLVTWESITQERFEKNHPEYITESTNTIYSVLSNLKDLLPGNYLLKHEPEHGTNALLYVARSAPLTEPLCLNFDPTASTDDAKCLNAAPTLAPVLLPFHKYRQILPCAFTTNSREVGRERAPRPPARQRPPPQAIKWPKKKGKKKHAQ